LWGGFGRPITLEGKMKRLFSRDEATGITKYWHVKNNGEYVIETVQDSTKIIEANKRSYNEVSGKFGEHAKVASIPLSVYYELKRQGIADDPKALRKWLNQSENRAFRTREGTL
jgi:hypothetical protein